MKSISPMPSRTSAGRALSYPAERIAERINPSMMV